MDTFTRKMIGIVGLGLIGGSLAAALGARHELVGVDRNADSVAFALSHGLIARGDTDVCAVKDCDAVFVCVPVGAVASVIRDVYAVTGRNALITDVASVKASILTSLPDGIRYVGGHPMAGKETGGIRSYAPRLFENAYYLITPSQDSEEQDVALLTALARDAGAIPKFFTAQEHDEVVARVSHLPHMVAYTLTDAAIADERYAQVGAGSFRDMTRVAASDPDFWADVALLNRARILASMQDFTQGFDALTRAIEQGDRAAIRAAFARAQAMRLAADATKANSMRRLFVAVEDRPNALGTIATLLGAHGINISAVSILHSREGVGGALDLGFLTDGDYDGAKKALTEAGYSVE